MDGVTSVYLEELDDKMLVVSSELIAERQAADEMHEYLDELLSEQQGDILDEQRTLRAHDTQRGHEQQGDILDELLGPSATLDHTSLVNIARMGGLQRIFSMVDKTLSEAFTSGYLLNHTALKGIKIFEHDLEGWMKYLTRKRKIAVVAGLNFQMFYPMKEYSFWDEDDKTEFVLDPKQIPLGFEIETKSSFVERG